MKKCIFCQIVAKKIPAKIELETKDILAFWDIAPKAPIHILIIPKKHLESINQVSQKDEQILGKMLLVAKKIAKNKKLTKGYRLIINYGPNAGQIVDHLHLHLLAGKPLGPMVNS